MSAAPVMSRVSRPAMFAALRMTVRGGLAGVWVRGRLPAGPVVWAANHHSWWDPFIAGTLLSCAGRRMVLLADVTNVHQYRFARGIGVVGPDELRTCLGTHLARLILHTALTPLCSGRLAQVGGDPGIAVGLTLRPRGPLRMRAAGTG